MQLKRLKKVFSLCLAGATVLSVATSVNAVENVRLIEGKDRVQTSIKSALENSAKTDYLILANAYSFADSLSSINLLNRYENSKLILVNNNTNISNEVRKMKPKKVILVGGSDVLNGNFIKDIYSIGIPIERISGPTRYDTNKKTLTGIGKVGVADGRNFPDALSAAPLLKKEGLGLLLVDGSKKYTTDKEIKFTFGDKSSVKQDGGIRIAGYDRYMTSEKINEKLSSNKDNIITYGGSFADALSSINLLNGNNKIVLLNGKNISTTNKDLIKEGKNIVVGGLLSRMLPTINTISTVSSKVETINNNSSSSSVSVAPKPEPTDFNKENDKIVVIEKPIEKDPVNENKETTTVVNNDLPTLTTPSEIKTQKDLDKYVISRFINGIDEKGESVIVKNENIKDISPATDYIIEDTGFKISSNKVGDKFNFSLEPSFLMDSLEDSKYNKDDFLKNLDYIKNDIKLSGALSKSTNYEKYKAFSIYVKKMYPYKSVVSNYIKEESSSPYSIWINKRASCLGYTYYNNLAAILMQIPSFAVVGDSGNQGFYHAENMFLDENGKLHHFNTTGIINYSNDMSENLLIETLKPTLVNFYYSFDNGSIKETEYLNNRKNAIKSDFYR